MAPTPRLTTAILAVVVVLAGLAGRQLLPDAVGGPAGDSLYATLVVLLVVLVRARTSPVVAAVVGLLLCAAVELAQLTGVPAEVVQRVPVARFVLGTTFVLTDLAWYAVGATVGGALVALASPRTTRPDGRLRHVRARAGERRRGPRAGVVVPVVVLVLLAAAGGGVAWLLHEEADALTAQVAVAQTALADSADRVADDAVRTTLSTSVDDAETLLAAPPLLERRPGDADAARERLERDVTTVQSARLEFARAQVADAREDLAPTMRKAEKVLAAVAELAEDGRGADEAARSGADDALAAAEDELAATADDSLDAAGPSDVEAAAERLTTERRDLATATTGLMTAQDAVVCPEPDQVWFPQAGTLAEKSLAPIPWAPQYSVRANVLDGLVALDEAYRARFGEHLTVNSAYRSYAQQVDVYNPDDPNPLAAPPGCSNHGLGTAVDVSMGPDGFDGERYSWLKEHAEKYGWTHPGWAEPDGRLPEPWHWQSVKTPTAY